ncbi:MAG: hypothetical protein EA396_09130 [Anaerolineaceae bacterium]|nr:MAG: hypothetical protein EA396_09130 [Anaerolineaceae bacterium]
MNINALFEQMERLAPEQLEALQAFINGRPYKREGRPPTPAERDEVLRAIVNALKDAPEPDENTGLERLRQAGLLDD